MYYNALFSLVFYPIVFILAVYKLETFLIVDLQNDGEIRTVTWPNYLLIGGLMLSAMLEYLRLMEGIRGNSVENVPKLSAFGLLSFLQFFFLVGCISLLPQLLPLMLITNWILLVFIVAEFLFMGRTLQRLVTRQTASFFRVVQNEYVSSAVQPITRERIRTIAWTKPQSPFFRTL